MNRYLPYAGIPISIGASYVSLFFAPYAFSAIIVGLPLLYLGRKSSAVSGFLVGALTAFSVYLFYPLSSVGKLAGIISQIIYLPGPLLIVLFPLFFGIIAAVSALFFCGIRELVVVNASEQNVGKEESKREQTQEKENH